MSRLVPRTLRARVSLLAALAVLAVLSLAGVVLVLATRAALIDNLEETLAAQAVLAADAVDAGRPLAGVGLLDDDLVVEVRSADGRTEETLPAGATPVGADAGREASRPAGAGIVVVTGSLEDVEETTAVLATALAVGVPLVAAALAGVVRAAVGRSLRPVERLRDEVDAIGGAALDRRVPEPAAPEEISRLARTMNAMLARLEVASERQRRFVADASHELRSPLARMRTELEVDAAHPGSADRDATAASVLVEVEGLQRLVDDLLALARADAGEVVRRRPVDLDEVLLRSVRRRSDPRVVVAGVVPVQVVGDARQLERAVGNLLDNAVRYARERVEVRLAVGTDGWAELVVADDGPGVPAADAERVFERFTRLDEARTAGAGGAGLGLAIARDVAERHDGTLVLEPATAGGARFVLRLPAAVQAV